MFYSLKRTRNKKDEEFSIESMIINEMIKTNSTMKDAVKLVSEKYKINKNEVYNASLNIKKLFDRS